MAEYTGWRRIAGAGALACAVVAAAGCGGGGGDKSTSSAAAGGGTDTATTDTTSGGGGKTFPLLKATWAAPDYMDPGLAYTVNAWQIMQDVYLGLVSYKHVNGPDGATVVPGLAQAMPKVTDGGKTYVFTLRKGMKYSDGTAIKASDFAYSIKRLFLLDSPGVGFFTGIVGADEFSKTKKGEISGITTDDAAGTVTIKLTEPRGDFLNILGTPFAALVPSGTPNKDQSTNPIPSDGPYQIASYTPNRNFTVTRNPNWKTVQVPGIPAGNPDKLQVTIVEDDTAALQTVLGGDSDYDQHTLPTDRLNEIQTKYKDQLKFYTPANTYYFFMNHRLAPFDKLQVRQAVNYAIDRNALVNIYGGLAQVTQNLLPPTYPQYKKISAYTYDLAKAKQLIKQAGATGAPVTVWGNDLATTSRSTQYLADQLNKIGLKAKVKLVAAAVYWQTVGNQATKAQIGFADWFQDYPHPLDWFDVLVNGDRITKIHNNNYGNVDVKAINAKIAELKKEPTINAKVNTEWAQVDQDLVVKDAGIAPFVNREFTDFFGSDIDVANCYVNNVLFQWDFAQTCKK